MQTEKVLTTCKIIMFFCKTIQFKNYRKQFNTKRHKYKYTYTTILYYTEHNNSM